MKQPDTEKQQPLKAQCDAPVGGQAVLEGVMMRGITGWAVAVRAQSEAAMAESDKVRFTDEELDSGEIKVESFPLKRTSKRPKFMRLPIIRGVVALGDSLAIGFKALGISANAQLPEEEKEISGGTWVATIILSLAFGIGLFFVIPVLVTSTIKDHLGSAWLFWLVEGVFRTTIFLAYLLIMSKLRELRRVFEYHGAEHKAIACYEASDDLTPERAALYSRFHPRCGTSFLLIVMIVAIFVFAPIGLPAWYWLLTSRILGVPLIAGISFEIIKWAGRNRSKSWVQPVIWPGMQLQRLTTREPNLMQLEVAVAALKTVLAMDEDQELKPEDLIGIEVAA